MKLLLRDLALSLSFVLAISSAAFGQKTYAIAVGGGAAIPVGKFGDAQKTSSSAIAAIAIGVAEMPFGLRFDGIYNNLRANTQSGATVHSDFRVMGVLANLIFAFPGSSAKPYVLVGGGLYSSKADVVDAKSRNDWGFNAGLGATFGIGPFATFIESRYHNVSRGAANGGVYQFVPITLGFMF
jgi:Outer membrane protein beta-barrel domain